MAARVRNRCNFYLLLFYFLICFFFVYYSSEENSERRHVTRPEPFYFNWLEVTIVTSFRPSFRSSLLVIATPILVRILSIIPASIKPTKLFLHFPATWHYSSFSYRNTKTILHYCYICCLVVLELLTNGMDCQA